MSIILKGIDIPDNDRYTTLRIYKNGHIWLGKTLVGIAIQIPKGARLIDANEIYIGRWDIDTDLADQILNAPTILESEVMPNE